MSRIVIGIFFIILFIFSSCTSVLYVGLVGSKEKRYGSTVEVIENGASVRIEYKSYKQLLIELNDRAKLEMLSPDELELERNRIPSGGHIIVRVSGITIGSANTKYWRYVVQTIEGEEILRESGSDNIPNFTSSEYGTIWWNIDIIPLIQPMSNPFKVYIIDTISKSRSGFIVYPDQ